MIVCCLLLTKISVFGQEPPARVAAPLTSKSEEQLISAPEKSLVVDSALFAPGSFVPTWSRGYWLTRVPESNTQGTINLRVFDAKGVQIRQASVWVPGASSVYLLAAVMGADDQAIVTGTALKDDGTRAYFIASVDATGELTNLIQTNPFLAHSLCVSSEGKIWGFGQMERGPDGADVAGDLLRQYDMHRGLTASFISASSRVAASYGGPRREVFVGCTEGRVVVYSGPANTVWDVNTANGQVQQYKIDRSVNNFAVHGFAMGEKGDVYGALADLRTKDGVQGLFRLSVLGGDGSLVRWVAVSGAVGRAGQAGLVSRVWGFDGPYLVHGITGAALGSSEVQWSKVQEKVTSGPADLHP